MQNTSLCQIIEIKLVKAKILGVKINFKYKKGYKKLTEKYFEKYDINI